MSLLMDARSGPETAKQEAARAQFGIAPATSPESTLSLEPLGGDAGSGNESIPDHSQLYRCVDADLASTPLPRTPPHRRKMRRHKPPASQTDRPGQARYCAQRLRRQTNAGRHAASRLPLWLALGTLGIAGIGIGGYVWYEQPEPPQLHGEQHPLCLTTTGSRIPVPAPATGALILETTRAGPYSSRHARAPPAVRHWPDPGNATTIRLTPRAARAVDRAWRGARPTFPVSFSTYELAGRLPARTLR